MRVGWIFLFKILCVHCLYDLIMLVLVTFSANSLRLFLISAINYFSKEPHQWLLTEVWMRLSVRLNCRCPANNHMINVNEKSRLLTGCVQSWQYVYQNNVWCVNCILIQWILFLMGTFFFVQLFPQWAYCYVCFVFLFLF